MIFHAVSARRWNAGRTNSNDSSSDHLSTENLYPEQYTVWYLLNAPRVSGMTTVTQTDMIQFK